MTTSRLVGVIAALALAACHSAVRPHVPHVSATSASASTTPTTPRPSNPARAEVDPAPGPPVPLQEEIATGHAPCNAPRSPIDDAPDDHRPLVIDTEARACRRRPLVQPHRIDEIPRD